MSEMGKHISPIILYRTPGEKSREKKGTALCGSFDMGIEKEENSSGFVPPSRSGRSGFVILGSLV